MKNIIAFLFALAVLSLMHEGTHAICAEMYGEYRSFRIRPYGLEVEFVTAIPERLGIRWAAISGTSNLLTCLLAYGLLSQRNRLSRMPSLFFRSFVYWLTLIGLLFDPLNLSIGPFVYGGDAVGIAVGLKVDVLAIQFIFFAVFLLDRELVARSLLPAFGVNTRHPLLRPLFPLPFGLRRNGFRQRQEEHQ